MKDARTRSAEQVSWKVRHIEGYWVEIDPATEFFSIHAEPREERPTEGAEIPVAPTLASLSELKPVGTSIVPASLLALKAKQFDDGLYAAVDIASNDGIGCVPGVAVLLRELLVNLTPPYSSWADILFAASVLGGLHVAIPQEIEKRVGRLLDKFRRGELLSKPLGFYTWNEKLSRLFQQGRMLQVAFDDKKDIAALVRALHSRPLCRHLYERHLELLSRLTNELVADRLDLRELLVCLDGGNLQIPGEEYCFFPPSSAHENNLVKKRYGNIIPSGVSVIEELIRQVRNCSLSLQPSEDSGWYDYQTWALEPFINSERMPESVKLWLSAEYKKYLEGLFKGFLALARETHVRQVVDTRLCSWGGPSREITLEPELRVEPLYSFYLRRAIGYFFIRMVLIDHFGKELSSLRRLTENGPVDKPLDEELREMGALFSGAAAVASSDLGLPREECPNDVRLICECLDVTPEHLMADLRLGAGEDASVNLFCDWAANRENPDLLADARMMVPLTYERSGRIRVWAFVGWNCRRMNVSYAKVPKGRIFDAGGNDVTAQVKVTCGKTDYALAEPVFAEVSVKKLMDREEFRAHCSRYMTLEAILKNLK